ncbi:MAG TPA: PQQ-dependent sugar dehydrogenase, partial [Pseudomonadales bacterium]|nr:PQQ-dependent sugar dehydrogenase [Pseudomonadales bacterium]
IIYATGLRNSAGFDWRPADGEIYATDNGRDSLGDNFPPCEFNHIVQGGFYGWPYANGDKVPDPDYGKGHEDMIARSIAPAHDFRAHNAPLGMVFYRGDVFPPPYRGAAIVALHGSWNRSVKDGYKVVSLQWQADGNIVEKDFVTGFLKDGNVIGRPAEVAEGPDGAIYIADDYAGAVYRVAYHEQQKLDLPGFQVVEYNKADTLAALTPLDQARLAQTGQALFKQFSCTRCHGDSEGHIALENIGTRYNIETLGHYLQHPRPAMPIFPMSQADRRALAVYLIASH